MRVIQSSYLKCLEIMFSLHTGHIEPPKFSPAAGSIPQNRSRFYNVRFYIVLDSHVIMTNHLQILIWNTCALTLHVVLLIVSPIMLQ